MRILLIEDDRLIGNGLNIGLKKLGFNVDWFQNGPEGEEALFQTAYDAVVLDLGLPEKDGLSILKNWRNKEKKEPVLILTARGDINERVLGLDSGADDYLCKPFALSEVAARLKALIRRNHNAPEPILQFKNICFYPNTKKVTLNNKEIELSPRERNLLELFLLNKNKILSKEVIEEKIYSWNDEIQSNAVEVHIHHLRRKLGKDIIKTVNKIGYKLGET